MGKFTLSRLQAIQNDINDKLIPFLTRYYKYPLDGAELTCSWHGCRYDIRTGRRLDYPEASAEEQLSVLPVRVMDGFVEVVVGTTSASGSTP